MNISAKRWVFALAVGVYLYFLLGLTATAFYELYHLTHIDPVYWGYSAFKAADYYLGAYGYKLYVSVAMALVVLLVPSIFRAKR